MKTLFKTITVVSLATLTAVGSTKFNKTLFPQQAESLAALNIYWPSEKNVSLEFAPALLAENNSPQFTESASDLSVEKKASVNLSDLEVIHFEPQSSFESEKFAANVLEFEERIKFKPSEFDENEAILSSLLTFTPAEIIDREIVEPTNIDQLIKFNPSIEDETIVEPVSETKMDQLIKFKSPVVCDEEIIEPTSSLDQLINFSPTLLSDSEIIEPVTKPASNCNTELVNF